MELDGWDIVIGGSRIHIVFVFLVLLFLVWVGGSIVSEFHANKAIKKWFIKYKLDLEDVIKEKTQQYPWMAQQFSDLFYLFDEEVSRELKYKKRPALKAAEQVSKIAKEKRALQKTVKMLEYQIRFYENAFPWLEEFKELDPKEAWNYATGASAERQEYEQLRDWLSPEEYQKLSNSEKYQLALDRYCKRQKTKWEVGIDFERYIGFELESQGYKVEYQGALLGLEDMGRDLVASSQDKTYVIQCKRWSKEKTIHEKHIFQLYGSVVLLSCQNPKKTYEGVFVTTAILSDVAKQCAEYLGIKYYELCEMTDYPMIKCNIGKRGEKIYHLPFDQQYDRVSISSKKGALYVRTVDEAEKLGFRRAYRWFSSENRSS